jgi:hypothetical protein
MSQVVQEGCPGLTSGAVGGLTKVLRGPPSSLIEADGLLLLISDGHDLSPEAKDH